MPLKMQLFNYLLPAPRHMGGNMPGLCMGLLILLWVWIFPTPAGAHHYFLPQVHHRIRQQVETKIHQKGFSCQGEIICGLKVIPVFYAQRNYEPVWFDLKGLRPTAKVLMNAIREAYREGLDPDDYHLETIDRMIKSLEQDPFPPDESKAWQWADLDLILTDAYLLLGSHLSAGRVNPETLHTDWLVGPHSLDQLNILNAATSQERMLSALNRLIPKHSGYTELKAFLERMRHIDRRGGWPLIPDQGTLRPGQLDERIPALRRRLQISEDLQSESAAAPPQRYDDTLAEAVEAFQRRHGLEPDGIVGKKTRRALNVSAAERVRQIELNLERWRWMPGSLGTRYILINTAGFYLKVIDQNHIKLSMKVVAGRPARKSPTFTSTMNYLVFNPYWNVPHTIAVEDILPRLIHNNVEYLAAQNIKVFDGWREDAAELDPKTVQWDKFSRHYFPLRLRQEPGEKNALGRIKFMFPNKFAVYLHDTPQRSLFTKIQRDFSSGCIRVENALALASYLLSDNPAWNRNKLIGALETGARRVVHIPNPITIYLQYMTAWVDEQGVLQFREDIYQRDRQLDNALTRRTPYPLPPLTPIISGPKN